MKLPDAVAGGSGFACVGGLLVLHHSPVVVLGGGCVQLAAYLVYRATELRLQRQGQQHMIELVKTIDQARFDGAHADHADARIEVCLRGIGTATIAPCIAGRRAPERQAPKVWAAGLLVIVRDR
jgi:hypothetical protein